MQSQKISYHIAWEYSLRNVWFCFLENVLQKSVSNSSLRGCIILPIITGLYPPNRSDESLCWFMLITLNVRPDNTDNIILLEIYVPWKYQQIVTTANVSCTKPRTLLGFHITTEICYLGQCNSWFDSQAQFWSGHFQFDGVQFPFLQIKSWRVVTSMAGFQAQYQRVA